jgi:hypothetical protein
MSERRIGWGRGPDGAEHKQPIEDVNTNPFERDRARVAARHAAAAATAVDTKRIKQDEQRHFAARHRQTPSKSAVMDPTLADAYDKHHADRQARRNLSATEVHGVTSLLALRAMIEFWQRNADSAVNFFESEFNYTSLTNCFVTRVFGRHQAPTPETVSDSFFECREGNHLELPRVVDANGGIVRRRGEPQPIPPTLYPKFIWPQEEAAARDAELQEAFAVMTGTSTRRKAEDATNKAKPLAELQKEVRSQFKPDALPADVIGSRVL